MRHEAILQGMVYMHSTYGIVLSGKPPLLAMTEVERIQEAIFASRDWMTRSTNADGIPAPPPTLGADPAL